MARQGRDVSSARYPEQPTVHLPEQIDRAAQRAAMEARAHAAAAVEQSRTNPEESK